MGYKLHIGFMYSTVATLSTVDVDIFGTRSKRWQAVIAPGNLGGAGRPHLRKDHVARQRQWSRPERRDLLARGAAASGRKVAAQAWRLVLLQLTVRLTGATDEKTTDPDPRVRDGGVCGCRCDIIIRDRWIVYGVHRDGGRSRGSAKNMCH